MRVINAVLLGAFALASMCRADVLYTFTPDIRGPWEAPAPYFMATTPTFTLSASAQTCSIGGWEPGAGGCYEPGFGPDAWDSTNYVEAALGIWSTFNPVIYLRASFPIADFEALGTYHSVLLPSDTVTGTLTVEPAPEPSTWGLLGFGLAALLFVTPRGRNTLFFKYPSKGKV